VIEHEGERLGVLICEDLWGGADVDASRAYASDPVADCLKAGATALIAASATPFVLGKRARQHAHLARIAATHGVPVLSCNQVGANDDLVFDGASVLVDAAGRIAESWPLFETTTRTVDLRGGCRIAPPAERARERDLIDALVCGIRGYFLKTGHAKATIGLSGGIDSAVVATPTAVQRAPAAEVPTLKLGQINERLGYVVTADLLGRLGFVAHSDRSAKLYREGDFKAICAALSKHTLAVAADVEQAA
jgi:hypothetical protein